MILKLSYIRGGTRHIHIDDVKQTDDGLSIIETHRGEHATHEKVSHVVYNRAELMTDDFNPIAVYSYADCQWTDITGGNGRQQILG